MKKLAILLGLVGCVAWGQNYEIERYAPEELDYNNMKSIDVNFDGYKDLVIPTKNGVNMKGEIAFEIYVSTKSGKLIYSEDLSGLYGQVLLDRKNKRIYTNNYYNACGYIWTVYQVEWRKPLRVIDEFFDGDPKDPIHKEYSFCYEDIKLKDYKFPKDLVPLVDY